MKYYINTHNFIPFIPEPVPFTCLFCLFLIFRDSVPVWPKYALNSLSSSSLCAEITVIPHHGWLTCDFEAFSMSLNLGCSHDLLWPGKHEKSQSLPILPCSLSERVLPLALLDPAFPWEQSRISLVKKEKSPRAKPRHVSHGHHQSHP